LSKHPPDAIIEIQIRTYVLKKGGRSLDIKDRGNIKWTSLMLVEHRKKLEKLKESEVDKKRPELDEQIYEQFDYKLKLALKQKVEVKITYYYNKEYKNITSYIKDFNKQSNSLKLTDKKISEIALKNIIDINLLN
jgi:hypothetical protein